MSFIISDKQYLASVQKKAKYVPYKIFLDSFIHKEIEITFGHPLYTFNSDFSEITPNFTFMSKSEYSFPIIPDGCTSIIIIISKNDIRGYFCGVLDDIKKIVLHENETAFIARYLPGGICSFLKDPIRTYANRCFDLAEAISNYSILLSTFKLSSAFTERIHAFSKTMRPQYFNKKEAHYLLNYCVDKIYDQNGNIKISELSKDAGFSERYIGKIFEEWVGISPKLYAEIMRFQFSLERLKQIEINAHGILLDTALDSGFFDHAHMNRCYQRFLHCTTGTLSKCGFEGLDLSNAPNLIS